MGISGVSEEQPYHQMCEAFPTILPLVIKRISLALYLEIQIFFLHESIIESFLTMPPKENQLASNSGLRDYLTVLTIGYLKPTMKSSDFQTAFKDSNFFTPLETTTLFRNMKHTTCVSTG